MKALPLTREMPREGVNPALANMPLTTIVWRALRDHYAGHTDRLRAEHLQKQNDEKAYVQLAGVLRQLRGLAAPDTENSSRMVELAQTLEETLVRLGVFVLAPAGETYSDEFMDIFESIAQVPDPECQEPRIHEVVEPAVYVRGTLARMGKAVIAVPASAMSEEQPEE